jgi:integrase
VVRKPRQGRQRAIEPLTPEDIERLRTVLLDDGDHRSATLVSVLAYAGLRPGEALGLEWRHVRERTLLIEQAVSDGHLKRQKTNRTYRTIDLLAPLADDLAEWKLASRRVSSPFVFPRPDGEPWRSDDWNNWRNRHFHPAAAQAGLGRPRPYDLRHAFASLLIREQRTSIVELAEQLGHAPTMTLNTYTHVFREHRRSEPVEVTEWIRRARIAIGPSRGRCARLVTVLAHEGPKPCKASPRRAATVAPGQCPYHAKR